MKVAILENGIYVNDDVRKFLENVDFKFDSLITSPPYYMLRIYNGDKEPKWKGIYECDGEHEWIEASTKISLFSNMSARKNLTDDGFGIAKFRVCKKCFASEGQLGNEPAPELYIEHLKEIFKLAEKRMSEFGNIFININDSYKGSKVYLPRELSKSFFSSHKKKKSLLNIPVHLAESLETIGLTFRQEIVWAKTAFIQSQDETIGSGIAESVITRFKNSHEKILLLTKKNNYMSELGITMPMKAESIRKVCSDSHKFYEPNLFEIERTLKEKFDIKVSSVFRGKLIPNVIMFKWDFKESSHSARMPLSMYKLLMIAGTPEIVCNVCEKPYKNVFKFGDKKLGSLTEDELNILIKKILKNESEKYFDLEPSCDHHDSRVGIAFDPFSGLGTIHQIKDRFTVSTEISSEYFNEGVKELSTGSDVTVEDLTYDEISNLIKEMTKWEKRKTKITVHIPECIDIKKQDKVKIGECRPISKTKKFVIIDKI